MSPSLGLPWRGWIGENGVECERGGTSWSTASGQRRQAETSERGTAAWNQFRQAKRLWKRYQEQGIEDLKDRAVGRRSNRAKPEKFRKRVLLLVRDKSDVG